MMTYSPVTTEAASALNEFDALWNASQRVRWELPSETGLPTQEMLLELLWMREVPTSGEFDGVPV